MPLLSKYLTRAVITLFFSATVVQGMAPERRATVCNGHAELCEKSYGSVSFVGAHDSYAIGSRNMITVNQDQSITQQLNDGIRMLQMQAHLEKGEIRLCHTSCQLFDGGNLQSFLGEVKAWLDANPNEVLSLLIVNIDNVAVAQYDSIFKAASLDTISFVPEVSPVPASGWPTLGSMIDSGKRLVTFLDNGAESGSVPYLLNEFTNVWETAFNVVDPNLFDCTVNRTKGDAASQMYLINHFLDKLLLGQPIPDVSKLNVTNAASGSGSLGAHVDACVTLNTRPPNFLLVDFYEFGGGSVFEVAARLNSVQYNPTTPIASPLSTSTSDASTPNNNSAPALSYSYLVASVTVVASIVFGAYCLV
ncbi:PLC-like phosphodiesterase [Collybia nuda]|uniref:PLC-like phosphodiesterase n=1 Tax=Collybia nuda TaxID=64659 RepID=A0A9P5XZW1_9AGAR|nr:PLC-like phosphodiesterase [Collybia nuda]